MRMPSIVKMALLQPVAEVEYDTRSYDPGPQPPSVEIPLDNPHIYEAIVTERLYQVKKWGTDHSGERTGTCANPNMPNGVRLPVLMEEVGEVAKAMNDNEPIENLKKELIQCAAVCVAWLQGLENE